MLVRFLEARSVLAGDGSVRQSYAKGETADLSPASARHWLSRGAAERISAADAKKTDTLLKNSESNEAVEVPAADKESQKATDTGKNAESRPSTILPPQNRVTGTPGRRDRAKNS